MSDRKKIVKIVGKDIFQRVAWLMILCLLVSSVNSQGFALETTGGETSIEVSLPAQPASGAELLSQAEKSVSEGVVFDFSQMAELLSSAEDGEKNYLQYQEMFDGKVSFALYHGNGAEGKFMASGSEAYGYLLVQVPEEDYVNYLETEDSGRYALTGKEDLVFLYVNGTQEAVRFRHNFTDLSLDDVILPPFALLAEAETGLGSSEATPSETSAATEETEAATPSESSAPDASAASAVEILSDTEGSEEYEESEDVISLIDDIHGKVTEVETAETEETAMASVLPPVTAVVNASFSLGMPVRTFRLSGPASTSETSEPAVIGASMLSVAQIMQSNTDIDANLSYTPQHQKYIEKQNGIHNLVLSVSADREASEYIEEIYSPVDIVFVLDKSGSMQYEMEGNFAPLDFTLTRAFVVNEAIKDVLNLFTISDSLRVAAINFGWEKETDSNNVSAIHNMSGWFTSYNDALSILLPEAPGKGKAGGWQAPYERYTQPAVPLKKALQFMEENGREEASKYVIFLSDGMPEPVNRGHDTATYEAVKGCNIPNLKFYAIRVTENVTETFMQNVCDTLLANKTANGITATVLNGSDEQEVQEALKGIKDDVYTSITKNNYNVDDVKITDTLSEYVDFIIPEGADKPVVTVTKTRGDESIILTENIHYTLDIDLSLKKVEVSLTNAGSENNPTALEANAVYKVSFPVKPTGLAYDEYFSTGYGDVFGEQDTDSPELNENEWISTNKAGFYSNEEATLEYSYGDVPQKPIVYQKPVVQIPDTVFTITKYTSGYQGDDLGCISNFSVKFGTNGTYYGLQEGAVWNDTKKIYTFTLKAEESMVFHGIPEGENYIVTEENSTITNSDYVLTKISASGTGTTSADSGTVSPGNRPQTLSTSGSILLDSSTAEFVNHYEPYGKITLEKALAGTAEAFPAEEQEFRFSVTPEDSAAGTYPETVTITAGEPYEFKVEPEDLGCSFMFTEFDSERAAKTTVNDGTEDDNSAEAKAGEGLLFTNYYYKHNILLSKALTTKENPLPDIAYLFHVKLDAAGDAELTEEDLTISGVEISDFKEINEAGYDYQFSLSLKAGESAEITNLPQFIRAYEVSENTQKAESEAGDGYKVELKEAAVNGTPYADLVAENTFDITEDQTDEVVFTNKICRAMGTLQVKKSLKQEDMVSDYLPEEKKEFVFRITGEDGVSLFVTVTVPAGNSSAVSEEIAVPVGSYTLQELTSQGFTPVGKDVLTDIAVRKEEKTTAAFVNAVKLNSSGYFSAGAVAINKVRHPDGFVSE